MNIFERKRLDAISDRLKSIIVDYTESAGSVPSEVMEKKLFDDIKTVKGTIDLMVTNSGREDTEICRYIQDNLAKMRVNYNRIRDLERKTRELVEDIRTMSTNIDGINYTSIIRVKSLQNSVVADCASYSLLAATLISSISTMLTIKTIEHTETTDAKFDIRISEFSRLEYDARKNIYENVSSGHNAFTAIAGSFDEHSVDKLMARFDETLNIATAAKDDGIVFEKLIKE